VITSAVPPRRTDDPVGVLPFTEDHTHPMFIEPLAGLVERHLQAHP
jgi:hypothetical protein